MDHLLRIEEAAERLWMQSDDGSVPDLSRGCHTCGCATKPIYAEGGGVEYVRADTALAAQGALIEGIAARLNDALWDEPAIFVRNTISPDATAALEAERERVRREERERCARIAEGWLKVYGDREIKHTSAKDHASDAVKDILDAIREADDD